MLGSFKKFMFVSTSVVTRAKFEQFINTVAASLAKHFAFRLSALLLTHGR